MSSPSGPVSSCCQQDRYAKYNLYKANPFDQRPVKNQPNQWCSNELILKDKALRCKAMVQPLDIAHDEAVSANTKPF
jgi:hypothetical protein